MRAIGLVLLPRAGQDELDRLSIYPHEYHKVFDYSSLCLYLRNENMFHIKTQQTFSRNVAKDAFQL